jgi:hypothetical protein
MKLSDRRLWFAAIVLGVIFFLTLLIAPNNPRSSGSTYSRAPDGYGAWYSYMQQQGTSIQRWQKSPGNLLGQGGGQQPITFLQVNSSLGSSYFDDAWIKQGNTVVILGVRSPVTEAAFTTLQDSPVGNVRIDTRRRLKNGKNDQNFLLSDRFGATVWQQSIGKGKLILASTPHLAANAYQDSPGNFKFLAQLVSQNGQPVYVDEYLHGYRDQQDIEQETSGSVLVYLSKTPLLPILVQGGVLLIVLLWAQNRRFGQPQLVDNSSEDNSTAYIQALASVLHKAESSEFVTETIGNEEKLQIQSALGLGRQAIKYETLRSAWVDQTQRPVEELDEVFQSKRTHRMNDRELLIWLRKLQSLKHHLPQ